MKNERKTPPFNHFATAPSAPKGFPPGCRLLLAGDGVLPEVWTFAVAPGARFSLPQQRADLDAIPCIITPLDFTALGLGNGLELPILAVIRRGRELADVATVMRNLYVHGRTITLLNYDMLFPPAATEEGEEGNGR